MLQPLATIYSMPVAVALAVGEPGFLPPAPGPLPLSWGQGRSQGPSGDTSRKRGRGQYWSYLSSECEEGDVGLDSPEAWLTLFPRGPSAGKLHLPLSAHA